MSDQLTISQYAQSKAVQQSIESVLGEKKNQFIASVTSLANANPKLKVVDKKSLFAACLVAATLDLPINQNLGFAYIIPYKVKVKENENGREVTKYVDQAQFQLGYKGFIQLSMRSGQFQTLNVTDIREGELVGEDFLTGEMQFNWIKDRDKRNMTPIVGYVAYFRLTNGFTKSLYMTKTELEAHGQRYSKTMRQGYGLWKDDFDAMAKKTVLKLLLSRYAPMSTDMAKAVEIDQTVVIDDKVKYLDNQNETPEEIAEQKERERIVDHINQAQTLDELMVEGIEEAVSEQDQEVQELFKQKQSSLTKGAK